MKTRIYIIAVVALCITSCQPNRPSSNTGVPDTYALAYEEIYGHCYDSVPYGVVALDLYSDGITLNKNHKIQGNGYNLYISDIFVPDSLLEEGTYRSSTEAVPFTILPGRDYDGMPYGLYWLEIKESQVASIQVLDSGSFVYRNDSLLFTLYFRNRYGSRARYTCTFTGPLIPWLRQ